TCIPALNMSIAKPTSAMNAVVGSAGSSRPKPVLPIAMPAASSPTTTGTNPRRPTASSRPASPAATTSARTPKPIGRSDEPAGKLGVLVRPVRGAGAVVAVGDDQRPRLGVAHEQDRREPVLREVGRDVRIRLRQKLEPARTQDVLCLPAHRLGV